MHLSLPNIELLDKITRPEHQEYLSTWRENAIQQADEGDVSSSICLQGVFVELALFGKITYDWLGVMNEFLYEGDLPAAYSKQFGKRLSGFENQYKQVSINAIHTRWWIERIILGDRKVDHARYSHLILTRKLADDGLVYDRDISETILRHRMKTELTMSMALSVEIIGNAMQLSREMAEKFAASLTDTRKCPPTLYMSTEYYRLASLRMLDFEELFPVHIEEAIISCGEGLVVGYCDFPMVSKFDAYMGTAKRTARDKPIHSPLSALHVLGLVEKVDDQDTRKAIQNRISEYSSHLRDFPMDVPSFQMRDISIPFGADKTAIEIICASNLISKCNH